ncbi:hypothetical protein FSARC_9967 [Fusarium sarcochroum]|uniref:Xylanolytic transcriptional activator regulatory domain-containing protein n=1 Tax=Fusarium sarcochroum TaxID=1208366 RepID=A0A8H4TPX2_9HYPO|nr:hypothetical protein FSARC_9967 [Fusarium sarcochroum]
MLWKVPLAQRLPASSEPFGKLALGETLIDRILQHGPQTVALNDETTVFTVPDERVQSSGLAFFSQQKVTSLCQKLGNDRLQDAVKRLDDFTLGRLGLADKPLDVPISFKKPNNIEDFTLEEAASYIEGEASEHAHLSEIANNLEAFFANIHPVYPFIDRQEFEAQALSPTVTETLTRNPNFSALYHSILALGSQFVSDKRFGSFEPGKGRSWQLFQVALSHMADIILPRESLESVQSLAALTIYALNCSTLQFDDFFISHAARMVVELRYHKSIESEAKHLRVFWVIYVLEKQEAMHKCTCSIIPDEDIGCMIPQFPEAQFNQEFNWFVAMIRLARKTSIICTSLFSISASLRNLESYRSSVGHLKDMLEEWRQTIPSELRPGDSANFPHRAPESLRLAMLRIHFTYYNVVISLDRLSIYLGSHDGERNAHSSEQRLMGTARTIIEMTKNIDIQPHVPLFILCILPVSAVFILFDFVIYNPLHRESRTNLSLLDTAAGYFSLLDIASKQTLPGSILPEFAHIAREYFWKAQHRMEVDRNNPAADQTREVRVGDDHQEDVISSTLAATTIDARMQNLNTELRTIAPTDAGGSGSSDYLEYPTQLDFGSEFQVGDNFDIRSTFGWAFPDWYPGGTMGRAGEFGEFVGMAGSDEMEGLDINEVGLDPQDLHQESV